ncbi:hypothetical protein [Aurantiacibacter gilvus]|uniref:Uncharacterized protein n=1 Tax=Aurantiacibacter gilvus TaxID=3139141 RepID=A0ABU9IEM1_9SPHN
MKLPKIDLSNLPDLDTLTGLFGTTQTPGHDDSIVVLATIIYENTPPGSGLI